MKIKDTRISAVFNLYIKSEVIAAGLSESTARNYYYPRKLAIEFFGDVPVETITAEDVRDFHIHVRGGHSSGTTQDYMIKLRAVLRFCGRKGVRVLDTEDVKIPKVEKRRINFLTETEVMEFINVVGESRRGYSLLNRARNVAIVEMLYATGLRVSELCRLNKSDIKNRQFTVIGKSKNPRICFITERVERILDDYIDMRSDNSPALFVANQTGKRLSTGCVRLIFRKACARSDFSNVHPHTIRHSFATKLLDKEVDIRYIGEFLGHESLDTTKIYTHFSNPKLRQIYEAAHSI